MTAFISAWELAMAAVVRVRVDSSVLDQLLRGSAEVRWEIQSLQDQGITVETLDPRAVGTADDLAALRQVLCDEAEIEVRPVGATTSPTAETAFWSVADSLADRHRLADLLGGHLYEPPILIHSTTGELTGRTALTLATRIGAVSPERDVTLSNGNARLVGLQEIQVAR